MDVTMLLADHAEAVEQTGKLYVSGAGWSMLKANAPAPVALAILVSVPWDEANVRHELQIELIDEDGRRVSLNGQEIVQQGHFEQGRPAGVPPGTALTVPLAMRFPALPLPVGGYSFVLTIDGDEKARASFRTMA